MLRLLCHEARLVIVWDVTHCGSSLPLGMGPLSVCYTTVLNADCVEILRPGEQRTIDFVNKVQRLWVQKNGRACPSL
jgi:hypothetical protein